VSEQMSAGSPCARLRAHLDEVADVQWGRALADGQAPGDDDCLDAEALALLEIHAATCPTCQEALGAERRLRDVLRRCGDAQWHAPESLRAIVVSRTIRASSPE